MTRVVICSSVVPMAEIHRYEFLSPGPGRLVARPRKSGRPLREGSRSGGAHSVSAEATKLCDRTNVADDGIKIGRRCVCTSKACKEAGVDTCKTKFSCYTELILTGDQTLGENATTRGCTEGATPLLCETKSWVTRSKPADNADRSPSAAWIRMPWPRLKCCDSHDYCNADSHVNFSTWTSDKDSAVDPAATTSDYTGSLNGLSSDRNTMGSIQTEPGLTAGGRESDQLLQSRVKPLHVAALVLAIAALISVLAACYVITRFLKANPYTVGSVE